MDPEYKVKYEKYKMTVKIWEYEFKKKNNSRIPSKYDIKEAPLHVKQAYKMYYRMKTSFLENTLNDVLDADEDFSQSESFSQQLTQHDDSVLSTSIQELLDTKNSFPSAAEIRHFGNLEEIREKNISIASSLSDQEKGIVKNFESEEKLPLNENAWGSHLNKKKPKKEPPKLEMEKVPSKLKLNISQSEVKSLRNPRKSLSRNLSKPRDNPIEESKKEVLPDLETLLLQKSRSGNDIKPQKPSMPTANSEVTHFVDQGWLDRNTSDTIEETNKSTESNNDDLGSLKTARDSSSFGLSGLNLKSATSLTYFENSFKTENKYHTIDGSDDEVVENSEDESAVSTRKILHIAKKRKILEEANQNSNRKMNVMEKSKSLQNVGTTDSVLTKSNSISCETILKSNEPKTDESQVVQNKIPTTETGELSTEKDPPVKPKRKFKSNSNTAARKKSTTPENIPIREKIPRQSSMRINYKEKLDVEEDGDFDGDDSDKDPDFGAKPEEIPEPIEDLPILKRKKSIIKKSKENLEKITKKATEMLKGRKTEKKTESGESDKELQQEKPEFVNYLIDSNLKKIKTLPRVAIKEIQKSEVAFEKYVKSHSHGATVAGKSTPDVNVKSQMAREKLEKRVASGTLNENYVRVNMKKKVFVRGKKVFNFSRYKKALWKGKKAVAALSGPDMDMRGCDGGVLKCFNCGGVGHFAQDCKQKGDNLLPLDAEMIDESPFLTLEEAADMANDKKMVVHYKNPNNIPEVRNEAWKLNENKSETDESLEEDSHEIDQNKESINNEVPEQETPEPKISYIGHKIPEDFLKKSGILELSVGNNDTVRPLYPLNEDNTVLPTTKEVFTALRDFGHEKFRPGQEKAIMRILSGVSTLVTLSTGSGKSLCYQLPAYLYKKHKNCITLVISPLVSLMEDQVHGVPSFLNAQCLHTNQTPKQRLKTMDAIRAGKVDILLVSPEAVVSGEKSTGFGALLRQLPPIAFACIDEAHCVSQWSHNFRPSYLMICRVLKEKLGVKTVLGLTATATLQTRTSIVRHLGIPDGHNGIISDIPLPDNLILTVSKDDNRERALIGLLKSDRFANLKSIIIYCTRRDECTRIAGFIRTCLQDEKNENLEAAQNSKKRKRINWNAEVYHAGLPASQRRTIQNAFMSGDVRIVVATIAFGMGINKADIRGIIHYNMPKSFESYVQEVGRAGRDGLPAHCHLFLDSKGQDMSELRRHIYADSIDRHAMRKLLQKIFVPCACKQNIKNEEFRKEIEAVNAMDWDNEWDADTTGDEPSVKQVKRICPGHEVCFSVEGTVQLLDLPEENVSTLLCYLELHEQRYIQVLGNAYTICKVMSYGGPKYLKQIAKTCPPLAMAIALDLKNGIDHENSSTIEFNVVDIAAAIGWDSGVVKYQLKQLEWTTVNGQNKRSALSVEFSDLGFRIKAPGDLTDEELDSCLDLLQNRCSSQEKAQLIQLQFIFEALSSVAFPFYHSCCNENVPQEPSEKLKTTIRQYFQSNLSTDVKLMEDIDDTSDQEIISDIRSMMSMYPENNFTGRALARIFHGISSPCYQAVTWGRCKYWRAHTKVSFYRIIKLANREILKMKS